MSDTYEFDAMISVMAGSGSREEAADKILEHFGWGITGADIAISLHEEGTLNVRGQSCECNEHKSNAMSAEYREAELIKVLEAQSCENAAKDKQQVELAMDVVRDYNEISRERDSLLCEGERYRKALEEIAKQKLSCQLIPGDVDFEGGYDCCVKRARGALCDITSDLVSEEPSPDTCPECHGTGKTVINKHIGVEDCPECGRDSEGQTPEAPMVWPEKKPRKWCWGRLADQLGFCGLLWGHDGPCKTK